jgi:hypothetical protein
MQTIQTYLGRERMQNTAVPHMHTCMMPCAHNYRTRAPKENTTNSQNQQPRFVITTKQASCLLRQANKQAQGCMSTCQPLGGCCHWMHHMMHTTPQQFALLFAHIVMSSILPTKSKASEKRSGHGHTRRRPSQLALALHERALA